MMALLNHALSQSNCQVSDSEQNCHARLGSDAKQKRDREMTHQHADRKKKATKRVKKNKKKRKRKEEEARAFPKSQYVARLTLRESKCCVSQPTCFS